MNDFNFHVKPIGLLDMLSFKKMVPARQKALACGSTEPLSATRGANRLASLLHPKEQVLTIAEVVDHGPEAKTFVLAGEQLAPFRAGQYLAFRLTIGSSVLTRPYSISSSPKWAFEGKYAVTIKRQMDGFASPWILDHWKAGDAVIASGPEGTFYYEPLRDAKRIIGLAGGSGITPCLALISSSGSANRNTRSPLGWCSNTSAQMPSSSSMRAPGISFLPGFTMHSQSEWLSCWIITTSTLPPVGL